MVATKKVVVAERKRGFMDMLTRKKTEAEAS